MNHLATAFAGFEYTLKLTHADGRVEYSVDKNLVPLEGRNHMLSVVTKGTSQVATWYLSLYEGNYTPTDDITAATYAAAATECTAYTSGTRLEWVEGAVAASQVDNSASKALFVFNANKTIYGAAMLSSSIKGGTTGTLLSIARFNTFKTVESGATLEVLAGLTLASA